MEKGDLEKFRKIHRKHLCQTLAQVFSCEFCKIFKNTFFTEHLWTTASAEMFPPILTFLLKRLIYPNYLAQRWLKIKLL